MPTLPAPMTKILVRRRCGTAEEVGVTGQPSATGWKKPDEAPPASKPSSDSDEALCILDGVGWGGVVTLHDGLAWRPWWFGPGRRG
ncbi:hypothetical protein D1007_45151 [Hordeum vulgare]|nr:hypothetical protein D1007_45151 [Hordeum vulgare]